MRETARSRAVKVPVTAQKSRERSRETNRKILRLWAASTLRYSAIPRQLRRLISTPAPGEQNWLVSWSRAARWSIVAGTAKVDKCEILRLWAAGTLQYSARLWQLRGLGSDPAPEGQGWLVSRSRAARWLIVACTAKSHISSIHIKPPGDELYG